MRSISRGWIIEVQDPYNIPQLFLLLLNLSKSLKLSKSVLVLALALKLKLTIEFLDTGLSDALASRRGWHYSVCVIVSQKIVHWWPQLHTKNTKIIIHCIFAVLHVGVDVLVALVLVFLVGTVCSIA